MDVKGGISTLAVLGLGLAVLAFFAAADSMLIGGCILMGSALIAAAIYSHGKI